MKIRPRITGFSLIEMAFVLVIVTLLLGGLLVPFTTQIDQKRIAETQKQLDEIKEALIGYALSHSSTGSPSRPYLPCPDATNFVNGPGIVINDGVEDRLGVTACAVPEGNLPWVTLGLSPVDAWGNRFHYRVTSGWANSGSGFDLSSTGDMIVCSSATGCPGNKVADTIPTVVLSFGKNGYGAVNGNTSAGSLGAIPCPAGGCSLDESENNTNTANTFFVSRTMTPSGTTAGEFDDIVMWLSPNVLYNRMVAAGKLP